MTTPRMPNEYPQGSFNSGAPSASPHELLEAFRDAKLEFDTSIDARSDHGRDWWPLSIGEVALGRVPHWPGVVVQPSSNEEVSSVLKIASAHRTPVTAQGGRSGVVGGAVAPDGAIAMDLTKLNRIISLDEVSGHLRVQAGVFGPELEEFTQSRGFTVGHFPQSFELATVGGWIACRGAGQLSNRFGKIEDIVRSLTVVLASGDIIQVGTDAPRQAVGPDLMSLFVGSEGTLGVITEATLVARRRASFEQRAAYSFQTFEVGLEACRRILQRDASPAVLRLYDSIESKRNFEVDACALIVLDEGDEALTRSSMKIVDEECKLATRLDDGLVQRWLDHRNDVEHSLRFGRTKLSSTPLRSPDRGPYWQRCSEKSPKRSGASKELSSPRCTRATPTSMALVSISPSRESPPTIQPPSTAMLGTERHTPCSIAEEP